MKFITLGSEKGRRFAVNPARVAFVTEQKGKVVVEYTDNDGANRKAVYDGLFHQAVADLNGD